MPFVALAGIGAVGEALVVLGIIAGVILIAWLISKFGSYIPLIGPWMAAQAVNFFTSAVSYLQSSLEGALWALTNVVSIVVITVTFPFAKIQEFTLATANGFWWVKHVWVPYYLQLAYGAINQALGLAYNYSLTLANNLIADILEVRQQLIDYTAQALQLAYAYTSQALTLAYSNALTLYYGAIAYVDQRVSAILALTYAVYNTLYTDLANLRTQVYADIATVTTALGGSLAALEQRLVALIEQYAAAAEKDAITVVDLAAAGSLTALWPGLITDVDGILSEIPQELTDIRDELASIPRALPVGLVDALAGLGALSIPMLRYLKECGVPMCRDLHGLTDLLGGLSTVATDAALVGIIIEAVHDPSAAAREINDVAGPVVRGAERLIRDLIGV